MDSTVKNGCTVQTGKRSTLNNNSEILTDYIKKEPEDLDDYTIFDLEERFKYPDEFKLEIKYDDKTIKIKKEIFEDTFENSEIHETLIKESANSTQSIFNEFVDLNVQEVNPNKSESIQRFYTCDLCHQSFNKKKKIIIHMKRHYFNHVFFKKVSKNLCSKSVKFVRPKRINHKKNSFECVLCLKQFTDYSNCRRHIQNRCVYEKTLCLKERPKLICHICPKSFTTAHGLKVHMRIHFNDKPFKCNFCQITFHRKDSLQVHERTHRNTHSSSFIYCDKCHKTFSSNSTLMRHKKMYKILNYQCDYCKCSFYRKHSLTIHIRSKHTGERPYQCTFCEKSFFEKKVLLSHKNMH